MTHVSRNILGDIADHYADVIEGTATQNGIPGTRVANPNMFTDEDSDIAPDSGGTTTTVDMGAGVFTQDDINRLQHDITASFFFVCVSDSASSVNVDAARKITTVTTAGIVTFQKAWPAATTTTQRFRLLRGFKRMPDGIDIESDHAEHPTGMDRFFRIDVMPSAHTNWAGSGLDTYEAEMSVRLRILKNGNENSARASMLENIMTIRNVLTKGSLRETSYTRAIFPPNGAPETVHDDENKLVMSDTYRLIVRTDKTFN